MSRRRKSNTSLIVTITIMFCALVCASAVLVAFQDSIRSILNPGTVQSTDTSLPVQTIIELTAFAANTQTAMAYTPTPFPSFTSVPPLESIPTATLYNSPTATPFVLPTQAPLTLQPTISTQARPCSCSADTLDCSDFSSQSSAQACTNYCVNLGQGDIHNLDPDGNGLACESLP